MSSALNSTLVILMVLHVFLANTVFGPLQVAVELVLIGWFVVGLYKENFTRLEIILLVFYLFATLVSFFTNGLREFMLAAKVIGLGMLAAIYFTKKDVDPGRIFEWLFIVDCFLLIHQLAFGRFVFGDWVAAYGKNWATMVASRPLGVFLNPHASSYFLAIFILYAVHKSVKLLPSLVMVFFSGSFFTFVSFLVQMIWRILPKFVGKLAGFFLLFFIICFIVVVIVSELNPDVRDAIIDFPVYLNEDEYISPVRVLGVQVLLGQLLSFETYERIFTLFPRDFNAIIFDWHDDFGNELMFFTLIQHAGLPLFVVYLIYIARQAAFFIPFIFVSLLHYGDISAPLFVYMFIMYSKLLVAAPNRWGGSKS
ncbi:MAG: hypothetical protein HQL94_01590 [Magnetococcales bacterium]|nr:hypothetical protein [Magnetococcales bacterium]MBF0439529.1 hypothetical protein [Magnetococcales bacterium]